MDKTLTIEEFNVLINSETDRIEDQMLKALHKLMEIEKPEDITVLASDEELFWSTWSEV